MREELLTDTLAPVVVSPVPFHSTAVREMAAPAGTTVRALLARAVDEGILPADDLPRTLPRTRVMIDGRVLDRETAMDRRIEAGETVNIEVSPMGGGGGGGKDVGQILLTIAVIAVSAWVGGPAGAGLGLKSMLLRTVASAAVMVLGQAAVGALFAPDTGGQAKANDRYALQSASNQYRPWAPFPMALGEVVAAPDLAVKTFTRAIGDDVWIYGMLGVHYGPCTVSDLKIGDTLASSIGSGDAQFVYHLTPGPRSFSLCPNDIDQADFQEELVATPSSATPVVRSASSEGEEFEFDFFLPGGLHFQKDDGRILAASVTLTVRYREIDAEGDPVGDGSWTAGISETLTSTTKEPWRVTRDLGLPMGLYEFEVVRSLKPDANEKRHDQVALTAIRAIAYRAPVTDETLSVIEFAIRATALNQGTLAPITCRIVPIAQTWTGSAWGTPQPTSNPAALTRWLLTGPAAARPLTSDQADVGLRQWSLLADEYDWTSNIYLTEARTQADAMDLLEQAGRASIYWDGAQTVASTWVEKPIPRQLFTGSNLKDHRWQIAYPEPVHALRVEFQNLDQGGEPDEVFVYADGYGAVASEGIEPAILIEALRLEGQKTAERAVRDGRWELGRRIHRRRVDTWTADIEHLVSRYGDRVRLAWWRLNEGSASGRVLCRRWSGDDVVGLRLTQPVTFQPGEDYAVDLRLTDSLQADVPVVNPATDAPVTTRELVFVEARGAEVSPAARDLVAFGTATRVSEDVEIIGIEPGEGHTASLMGVRYVAPLLLEGETAAIPPLQTRLSRERSQDPPAPTLLGVQVDDTGVRVGFSMPPWRGSPVTGFACRWRPKPEAGQATGWVPLPALDAAAMTLTTPPLRELPVENEGDVEAERTRVEIEIVALTAAGWASSPLLVTASKAVAPKPLESAWSVTVRSPDADGSQQPGLTVVRLSSSALTPGVIIEYATSAAGPWRPAYSGPATLARYDVTGLSPVVAYWVAITNVSAQGVASARKVFGPYTVGDLMAGGVGGTRAAELLAFFREIPRLIDDSDLAAEVLIRETLDRHERIVAEEEARIADILAEETARIAALTAETAARIAGLLAEAAARGTAIAGVTSSITTVATDLAAEITTRTSQYAATSAAVALVDTRVTTVVSDLAAETSTRTSQVATLTTNIAAVNTAVTTVATNLASLTSSVTSQFSTVNGTLASHSTSITTNATAISAETTARTAAISTVNASIAAVAASVTTVASDLASLTTSVTSQFSTVNGTLASHTTSISTNATAISAETTARTAAISTVNASIAAVVASVTTVASDLASLTTSTTSQFSTVNASIAAVNTAVTTVATDLASEVASRETLAASTASGFSGVSTSLSALSSADAVLSAAVTTAQTTANGASSSATFAISALNGNEAYVSFQTNVGGLLAGLRLNGAAGSIDILSTAFNLYSIGTDAQASYIGGRWYILDPTEGVRVVFGLPFGGTQKLVLWAGPNSTGLAGETKANAYVYISMNTVGGARFGGSDAPVAGSGIQFETGGGGGITRTTTDGLVAATTAIPSTGAYKVSVSGLALVEAGSAPFVTLALYRVLDGAETLLGETNTVGPTSAEDPVALTLLPIRDTPGAGSLTYRLKVSGSGGSTFSGTASVYGTLEVTRL